jgi:hypothetical protein
MLYRPRLECTQCGAPADAACNCGVAYVPAGTRAAEAIAASPEKSDRAIATDIGVGSNTVRRARKRTAPHGAVDKRLGQDGKLRKLPNQKPAEPRCAIIPIDAHEDDESPGRILELAWNNVSEDEQRQFVLNHKLELSKYMAFKGNAPSKRRPISKIGSRKKKLEPSTRTVSVAEAASEAYGMFRDLGEEMQSWADNIEEHFSQTSNCARVSEAAEALSNVSEPTIPDRLKEVRVEITDLKTRKRGHSRRVRCEHACGILGACVEVLEKIAEDEKDGSGDDVNILKDKYEEAIEEVSFVEFPGMYG